VFAKEDVSESDNLLQICKNIWEEGHIQNVLANSYERKILKKGRGVAKYQELGEEMKRRGGIGGGVTNLVGGLG
jgi:hypothetical protein